MLLEIGSKKYELVETKLKLKAIRAIQNFDKSENFDQLVQAISLILNEPDTNYLNEELTIGHIADLKNWILKVGEIVK